MTTNKSLGLIAALALASHAPGLREEDKRERRIVSSPQPSEQLNEKCLPTLMRSFSSENTSYDTIDSDETQENGLEDILNDPIFKQAVKHVKETLHKQGHNSNRNASTLCMNDPKVQQAILQAKMAMQNPRIQEMARRNNLNVKKKQSLY